MRLALKTALVMIVSLCPAATAPAARQESSERSTLSPTTLFELQYPVDAAVLNELWTPAGPAKPADDRVIVHVQDAHCNFEAQMNIAKLVERLTKRYGITLIAVEGTEGPIDTSILAEMKDEAVKDKVIQYFMRQGKITGPEYLSIMKRAPVYLFGIEDARLYDANLRAFKSMLPVRDRLKSLCGEIRGELEKCKKLIYSKELLEMDRHYRGHLTGESSLPHYVAILNERADPDSIAARYPNFRKLQESVQLESRLDAAKLGEQQQKLMDKLSRTLSKAELGKLVAAGLQVRLGRFRQSEYFMVVAEVLERASHGAELSGWREEFNEVALTIEYSKLYEAIDQTKLFDEIDRISGEIFERLFKNETQRRIHVLSTNVYILGKLLLLEVSRSELVYYRKHREDFKTEQFLSVIRAVARQNPSADLKPLSKKRFMILDEYLETALNFYRLANKRDRVLVANTLRAMKDQDARAAVMITGGYHTGGIREIFKKKAIAYAVMMPKITDHTAESPYLDVMTQQRTAFEEFLERSTD